MINNRKDFPVIYYFFFTDGGNTYPQEEVTEFGRELKNDKSLWTNRITGVPKLFITIVTDCATVQSLTMMKEEFDKFANEIWGEKGKDFCTLKTSVSTD